MQLEPVEAAKQFVNAYFPQCQAALLAGSASRGEHTASSDLDIIVVDHHQKTMYRESFYAFGWKIEAFIHTGDSYKTIFESDRLRAGERAQELR